MRMTDVKKAHRGVLLNREDIIKCERCAKVPLSRRVRDLLHEDMAKYELDPEGRRMLEREIGAATEARKAKHPKAGSRSGRKAFACGYEDIPETVRKGARFVRGPRSKGRTA